MADAYEREQMPGIGETLFRHKVSSPRWLIGLMAGLPLALGGAFGIGTVIGGALAAGLGIFGGAAALSALMGFVMVTFSTARVAVSEGEVHLQLGFAGPRFPIEEIAGVRVAPSGSNRVGMGVRKDLRGTTLYTLWGDNARAVHIERTDGTRLVVVMKEPEAMARAIEEAMRRRDRAGVRVRVAADDEVEGELEPADRPAKKQARQRAE
ncbi:MAG: hypothetical protein M5U28_47480 [Sandaracinaceae bacterium]|nr:hypothetical protein [Sandaracinaceae bacterium]